MAGEATPWPTAAVHFGVSSLGQAEGALKSLTVASRFGPLHCGQSAASTTLAPIRSEPPTTTTAARFACFMMALRVKGRSQWRDSHRNRDALDAQENAPPMPIFCGEWWRGESLG